MDEGRKKRRSIEDMLEKLMHWDPDNEEYKKFQRELSQEELTSEQKEKIKKDYYRLEKKQKTKARETEIEKLEEELGDRDAKKPEDAKKFINLGLLYCRIRKHGEGKECFEKVRHDQPENSELHMVALIELGRTHSDLKEYDEAINYFDKVVLHNPYAKNYKHVLTRALVGKGVTLDRKIRLEWKDEPLKEIECFNKEVIEGCFKEAEKISPESKGVWCTVGVAYGYMGAAYRREKNYEEEEKCYEKEIECAKKAIECAEKETKPLDEEEAIESGYPQALNSAGIAHNHLGFKEEKKHHPEKAKEHFEEAKTYFEKALEIDDTYKEVEYGLGLAHLHLHEYVDAIDCFENALAIYPGDEGAKKDLEKTYEKMVYELYDLEPYNSFYKDLHEKIGKGLKKFSRKTKECILRDYKEKILKEHGEKGEKRQNGDE